MLFDIHTHVNFKAFESDGHEVIKRALQGGVGMILVGSQNTTSKRSVDYAREYPKDSVYAAVGLHPIHLEEMHVDDKELGQEGLGFTTRAEEFDYEYYRALAQDPKVVAIGEVGLDYHWTHPEQNPKAVQKQKDIFKKQIELALETKKALMVHCRKAHKDCIAILKEYYPLKTGNRKLKTFNGDIHFFEGTLEEAKEYFNLGFTISFTGVITFKNSQRHQELVKALPLERMLLETDAPYVTPEPHRGKRNEPLYVKFVAEKVAQLKGVSVEEVENITSQTAKKVFHL